MANHWFGRQRYTNLIPYLIGLVVFGDMALRNSVAILSTPAQLVSIVFGIGVGVVYTAVSNEIDGASTYSTIALVIVAGVIVGLLISWSLDAYLAATIRFGVGLFAAATALWVGGYVHQW